MTSNLQQLNTESFICC
jgi:hypothetical protein